MKTRGSGASAPPEDALRSLRSDLVSTATRGINVTADGADLNQGSIQSTHWTSPEPLAGGAVSDWSAVTVTMEILDQ
jgi:hypothetical protein